MSHGYPSFDPNSLRQSVLNMAYIGQSVHVACAFSIIEILAVLYREHLHYPEGRWDHPLRDYLILSKGHGVMAQYACLHEKGWIISKELERYFQNGTRLRGLSEVGIPGIEVSSGSLGHGLSIGSGLALGAKRLETEQMVYTVIGDGEANEGAIWEAVQFAAHFKLDNLVVIIDKNDFQAMGPTTQIIEPGDLVAKLTAFGFDAMSVDGHDELALHSTFLRAKARRNGRPKGIVAQTVKGKGVSFMENDNIWHYRRLDEQTYRAAGDELKAASE